MHIIICLDDKNGMLFNSRRQSSDRMLYAHLLASIGTKKLWMNAYSFKQFSEHAEKIIVCEEFLERAEKGEFCFVENTDISLCLSKIENVIIYRWNRRYPADQYLPEAVLSGRKLASYEDFAGYSHEKITQEVYVL